jgi:hypothetical protein
MYSNHQSWKNMNSQETIIKNYCDIHRIGFGIKNKFTQFIG